MSSILNQPAAQSLSPADQLLIWASSQGDTRRIPLSLLTSYLAALMTLPDGLLSAAGVYVMNVGVSNPNLTNVYANIPVQNPALNFIQPAGAQSLGLVPLTGEFVASRTIKAASVNVNIAMTYAAARRLTLAVLTGPDASPYETPLHFSAIGQDATQMYANFGGLVYNPTNVNGQINAGDKIRLVAKFDVAGPNVLAIQSMSTQIQTLDGI